MTPIKRVLWVTLFVLGGLTGISAKASATQEIFWHCRTCNIPEVCYPGAVCAYNGGGDRCFKDLPNTCQ